jgi:hypothetical protein
MGVGTDARLRAQFSHGWGTMTDRRTIRMCVVGAPDMEGAVAPPPGGGRGVRGILAASHPDTTVDITTIPETGLPAIRGALEDGTSPLLADRPDIVLLSVSQEIASLHGQGIEAAACVAAVEANLVAIIDLIKERVGSHVFTAGISTLDGEEAVYAYKGLTAEPFSLFAHRLDDMLITVSREHGVSLIDVDREIAELGGAIGVAGPARYTAVGSDVIAAEIARVIDDYGFLDDRPLVAQVGAKGIGT